MQPPDRKLVFAALVLFLSFITVTANGFDIPLYQNNRLHRRSPAGLGSWAVIERTRLSDKYATNEARLARRAAEEEEFGQDFEEDVVYTVRGNDGQVLERKRALPTAWTANESASAAYSTLASTSDLTRTPSQENVGQIEVFNLEKDIQYFATVAVGVPPQFLPVILDTGSADLWIISPECNTTTGCQEHFPLNISQSVTAVDTLKPFAVRYGGGSASGDLWTDYVSFGGYNVSKQSFAVCDNISEGLLSANVSGLMGMGFRQLAASKTTPFWQNLWQAGILPFPGFAFLLSRFNNVTTASQIEPGGFVNLGYLNRSLYDEPIEYVDIPNGMESYWVIPMEGIHINGTNVTGIEADLVAIDTGTTLLGGPRDHIEAIYGLVPGAAPATVIDPNYTGYWTYPCESNVTVGLTFGETTYNMTPSDFSLGPIAQIGNVSTCLGAFFELSLGGRIDWVIGAAFLKNVYSIYRAEPPAVGFAQISSNPTRFNGSSRGTGRNESEFVGIPTPIIGPSGVTSSRTSLSLITAIQAGQTMVAGVINISSGIRQDSGTIIAGAICTAIISGLLLLV